MNIQGLAKQLDCCEYGQEISPDTEKKAKAAGLVVVFGASDDLTEFRGAINDETGLGNVYITSDGILSNECDGACPYFQKLIKSAAKIKPVWDNGTGYSFTYETTIPHATFDVMEDGGKYCRGIVFDLNNLTAPTGESESE